MPYVKRAGGRCPLCSRNVPTLEFHHLSYDPEIIIKICHKCHFLIHFFPDRLTQSQKILLKKLKF